jgi:guanosine-3',5'-bis(diphosphate) 3'-pyrophosphohydrolase
MKKKPAVAYPRLHRALRYAAKKHRYMDRDGDHPLPYVTHPIEVVRHVRHMAGITDEDVLCAAALHDLVEDTDVTLADIEKKFGPRVASIVAEVTRRVPTEEETAGMSPQEVWSLRNDELMEEIDRMSPEAKTIKLADRLSNIVEGLQTRSGSSLTRYVGQTRQILQRIPRSTCPPLWDAIENAIEGASASDA